MASPCEESFELDSGRILCCTWTVKSSLTKELYLDSLRRWKVRGRIDTGLFVLGYVCSCEPCQRLHLVGSRRQNRSNFA